MIIRLIKILGLASKVRLPFLLLACTGITSVLAIAQSTAPANIDWPYYGNDPGGMRFVDTDIINTSNVSQLQPAWIVHTGVFNDHTSLQSQPIVVNGIMYVTSPHAHVFALNASTGALMWTYTPSMPPLSQLALPAGQLNRGVAVGNGMVFLAQPDATLVALNATSGAVVWQTEVEDWQNNYTETMAPLFVNGKVIVGITGGEYMKRGFVSAYDATSGGLVWRFYTCPSPGEMGNDTWANNSWMTGGGTVWSTPVADPALDLVYVPTGNAAPDENGSQRAGTNLFANSVVALNIDTGAYVWHFQEVHHDVWDYDADQPPHLFTANIGGQQIPAIGHANKDGFYYILDRRNGNPLFPVTETPVPSSPAWQNLWPTQPIPSIVPLIPQSVEFTPPTLQSAPIWTAPSEKPTLIQPGYESGPEWTPSAFSPRTNFAYLQAGGYEPWISHAIPGEVNTFGSTVQGTIPGIEDYGLFDAVDTTTGKMAWQLRFPEKVVSGVVVAGDLVFMGESNGTVNALDSQSGATLWSYKSTEPNLGGANAPPAVYVVNGQEYFVMAFGGNNQLRQKIQHTALTGDVLIAFALPTSTSPASAPVINLNPPQVPTGAIPASSMMDGTPAPAPGAQVVEISGHDFHYDPNNFVTMPGALVSLHLANNDLSPLSVAIGLPAGPVALNGMVIMGGDTYYTFTAPTEPGMYSFYSPLADERFIGYNGFFRVAAPCPTSTTPCLSNSGVVSSASSLPGAVAPGELITIFGEGLGPDAGAVYASSSGSIGSPLAGTQVTFDGIAAPLLYVQNNQVNAIVPYEEAGKSTAVVQVMANGVATNEITVDLVPSAPALFTSAYGGVGQAVIQNVDGTANSVGNPAPKGSVVHLFVTGDGVTSPAVPTGSIGQVASAALPVTVLIGGYNAIVASTEISPDFFSGVLQVDVMVPSNVVSGGAVSLQVTVGNMFTPPGPTIAIQ